MYKVYKGGKLMGTHPTLDRETIKSMQAGGYVVKLDGKAIPSCRKRGDEYPEPNHKRKHLLQ